MTAAYHTVDKLRKIDPDLPVYNNNNIYTYIHIHILNEDEITLNTMCVIHLAG